MSGLGVTKHGFTYHSMWAADNEEIAASVRLRGRPNAAQLFARKMAADANPDKCRARSRIMARYRDRAFPQPLRFLSMPGLRWSFEKGLWKCRTNGGAETEIHAVENDPAIYRASLGWIPVGRHSGGVLRAESATLISTTRIASYRMMNVEDLIVADWCPQFDAAWLDFTGPLSLARLEAIRYFWEHRINHGIIITSLAARYAHRGMVAAISKAGSLIQLVESALPGSELDDVYSYGVMRQFIFKKRGKRV